MSDEQVAITRNETLKKVACYALKALHFIADNEPSGRELFVQTVNANGTGCLEELVHCIGIHEHSCFKYAFLVLHNLMSDGRIGPKVIAFMCEMRILTKVLGWLTEKNERFLNIVTDMIDKLITQNSEQMAFFIGLNGHQKLIKILTMAPLDQQMPSSAAAETDAAALQQQQQLQAFTLLNRVAKLLYKITLMVILWDITFLENGAIYCLFHLLYEMDGYNNNDASQGPAQCQQMDDDIEERAMALLKFLCKGNDRSEMAKMQVMGTEKHKRLLLESLRQRRNLALLRRTLMLVKLLAQDDGLVGALRFAISFPPPPSHSSFPHIPDAPWHTETCSFAKQLVLLLYQSMNSLPDIFQQCLDILRSMAGTGGFL